MGLLPAYNSQQLPFAYEFYKDGTPKGAEMAAVSRNPVERPILQDLNVLGLQKDILHRR